MILDGIWNPRENSALGFLIYFGVFALSGYHGCNTYTLICINECL